ncbi:MAG: hypothetical protein IJG33_11235 [Selenomonadaceae bacterium]|nr:hypothetical protein [Selenomonadaceae bacterium]
MMNIQEMYSKAEKLSDAKSYDAALKILEKIKRAAPRYRKAHSLEAFIWKARNNSVKEYYALKRVLPLLDFSSPKGKRFAMKILALIGRASGVLALNEESLKYCCSALELDEKEELPLAAIENAFFMSNTSEKFSVADLHAFRDKFKKRLTDTPFPRQFYNHEKIRIGFVSGDFHLHPVMNWSWPLMTKFDRNLFELYCYSNDKSKDKINDYLRTAIDNWRDIYDLKNEQAAKLIRDDEIDILFDLSGHTGNNRLLLTAYRPASVQIVGVGDMFSTGFDCVDYFLADVYCAGDENFFTEKVIKLPHSHICYEPTSTNELTDEPPCIKNGFVTFGSFNQFQKITDAILIAWQQILYTVPNSRLILKNKIIDMDGGRDFILRRLKKFGFDLAQVELRPTTKNYLSEYNDVDIALDTFPYTGGVTTCEALHMGVPVISLYGTRHGTRFGLSILKNIGLDELAVNSYQSYVERAISLAGDWELLNILKKNLRTMMKKSPLMDSIGYIREVEQAFIDVLDIERSRQ